MHAFTASWRGVRPRSSVTFTLAPREISSRTTSWWARHAAMWRAVELLASSKKGSPSCQTRSTGTPRIQQATHSGQVVDSGKAAQERAAFTQKGFAEGRILGQQGTGVGKVSRRAGGDKPVARLIKAHVKAATLEQVKDVFAAMMGGHLQSIPAGHVVAKERICAVVKKHFDGAEGVVAKDGLLQRGGLPGGQVIGIGPVLKSELHAFLVVPVGFADEQGGE